MAARKSVSNAVDAPEPVVIGGNKKPVEKFTLFVLNGVEYDIPKKVDPRIGLRMAERLSEAKTELDQMAAQLLFIKEMLGEDAYNVLMNDPAVDADDFEAVLALLQKVGLGQSEATKN